MTDIDNIVSSLNHISLLAQLRDKVAYAQEALTKRCGRCSHWIKSRECPRELMWKVIIYERGEEFCIAICRDWSYASRCARMNGAVVRPYPVLERRMHRSPIPTKI